MTKTRIPGVAVAGWRRRLTAGSADRGLAVVAALVAAAAAPVAAQDDDYVLGQLTPAYTQGPFFVAAYDVAEECGPSEASMERIIEGELLRAGMETGPNEHAVVISASTTGYEMESRGGRNRGCAVSVQTEGVHVRFVRTVRRLWRLAAPRRCQTGPKNKLAPMVTNPAGGMAVTVRRDRRSPNR